MFLKSYTGDVTDLCLTFSVTENALGETKEIDLVPGGSELGVTQRNRLRYINLVAHYYLNTRTHAQSSAFLGGFYEMIRPEWIAMFTQPELQTLISGSQRPLDVADMRKHTTYKDGYMSASKQVMMRKFTNLENVYHIYRKFTSIYW
jgi:hypothetical protein